ncbi:aldo/keto reductase [Mesonia aquimarina]|uniref:aldo/keto reductase n=1 Tax=Mesonia aquimarina TaxID=1504967 RepID=UPI000EF5F5F8|nr:aldo/keto reductase [Mesonia aquimarina]
MSTLINKIGLGTVQFGTNYGISNTSGKTTLSEVEKIIQFAEISRIQYVDTAYAYGDAEEVLGKFNLSSFKVISKYIPNKTSLSDQFLSSLTRLNIPSFHGYLAHRPLDLIADEKKNWKTLLKFKEEGKVKKIGASFNTVEELEQVLKNNIALDIVQVPYNYFDTRFEKLLKQLKKENVEVHSRSAFLQGLFFCNPHTLSDYFNDIKPLLSRLQQQDDLAQQLLHYALEKQFIDVVNIGVNDVKQLRENVEGIKASKVNTLPKLETKLYEKIIMPSNWLKSK